MQLNYAPDRRQHSRIPLVGLVRFQSPERTYTGYLLNISRGGLMLKARELPRPDEEITLNFQLLPSSHAYELKAVVMWVAPETDPDSPRGMGVRFIDLGGRDRKHIEEYIGRYYP